MNRYATVSYLSIKRNVTRKLHTVTNRFPRRKIEKTVQKRPFVSFFAALLFLFILIVLGNFLAPKPQEEIREEEVTSVEVYSIGVGPVITAQAKIQKTGVIHIVAQTQGVVQDIHVSEGQEVKRGQKLVSLSTNYQGGNIPQIQASIASRQYQNTTQTYDAQKELIEKQREVANANLENTEEMRRISAESLEQTRSLLNLQNEILRTLQTDQTRAPIASAILQLQTSVKNLEYEVSSENPPTELSNVQRDITRKQLEVQEKSLELSKEVARLQLQLAQVQASLMFPSSPSNGTVQRVHVVFGQNVSPGTRIATIFQPEHEIVAVSNINADIAAQVSQTDMSTLILSNGTSVHTLPTFVSTEATNGKLYSMLYSLPQEYSDLVTDQEFISVHVPLAVPDTSSVIPLIPIDAVYKTEEGAYVFVVENGRVTSRTIQIGEIFGSYIEIENGLKSGDMVILNRNVVDGDTVIVTET